MEERKLSKFSVIAGATNFPRQKYSPDAEGNGVYVITVSAETKAKLIDGDEFEETIELNDLELKRAILQKSNLKNWRIAIEVNSGTTILLGEIIGVKLASGDTKDTTTLTCLMTNGSYLTIVVEYTKATQTFVTTLTSAGKLGNGGAKVYVESVENIDSDVCEKLACGDIVIKQANGKEHAYLVAYKKANEMSLVYVDHENAEEVYYEKSDDTWAFVVKDITELGGGLQVVEISAMSGTLTDEQYNILNGDNAVIKAGTQYYYKEFSASTLIQYKALARMGVDKVIIEYYTIQRATKEFELTTEELDKGGMEVVTIDIFSGTFSDEDYAIVSGNNCLIFYSTNYYYKTYEDNDFIRYDYLIPSGNSWLEYKTISINKSTKGWYWSSSNKGLVQANPTLTGTEAELLGLQIGSAKYQSPKLSNTDNITCAYATPTDFTIADSYSSYNRCGAIITFVLAFSITKDNATTTPINIATFSNIPNTIFTKLVPTTVGLNEYLDQIELDGFSDTYTNVKAPVNLTKGLTDSITLALDPTNLVVNTKYHFRYFVSFLLTDNLTKIDPILDNNSWADINTVFLSGDAANYWSVGDLKNFTGSDGVPRQQRIVDLSGLYNKHGVFEQVALDGSDGSGASGITWNSSSNVDGDNAYNDWNISDIRAYLQSTVLLRYPSDLQAILTNTTIQTATNGNNGTLVSTSDKLFIAAEKELSASSTYSRSEERAALSTWQYYQTHSNAADRIKYRNGALTTAGSWWTRSPSSGYSSIVVFVDSSGTFNFTTASTTYRVAPAFAL